MKNTSAGFASEDEALLGRDLPRAAIAELGRALWGWIGGYAVLRSPGARALLTPIDALLREADRQGLVLPPEVRRWLEGWAFVARANIESERRQRKHRPPGFRPVIESLTLRIMRRHGMATGGQKAARVLAIALKARLGIPKGDAEGQKQALIRARRRLRAGDPLDPTPHLLGRVDTPLEEWAGESLRPV